LANDELLQSILQNSDKYISLNQDISKCHEGVKAYDEKIFVRFGFIARFYKHKGFSRSN
jgi:hypothetical protein